MTETSNYTSILINELYLDPENPRLPERLKNAEEKDVLNWMLSDATLIDLMASIAENNFFNGEPILAVKENNRYIVVEGNRRLAAIKLLKNPQIATTSPKSVKAVSDIAVQKNNIPNKIWVYVCKDRNESLNYLAFRHVTGVKQWPLISKARYLYKLFKEKKQIDYNVYKELAREIGSKGAYVKKLLTGFQAYLLIQSKNFFGIQDLDEDNFDLSLISEVISEQPTVAEYLGIDTNEDKPFENLKLDKLEEVTKWLYQITETGSTRVGDNRNLRLLTKILKHEEAKKAFIEDGKSIKEAAELTDLTDENIRIYLRNANLNLIDVQRIIHKAKLPNKKDIDLIEEILNSAELISSVIKKKMRANSVENLD